MKTVLFQGDSITDAVRTYTDPDCLGTGYPRFVFGRLGLENPGDYKFYNRGISGNRIVDIYARIKKDILNLKPDYMSILVGVNDVWHELDFQNGVSAEKFEKIYTMLLEEVFAELPNLKLLLIEPFVLKGPATTEHWDYFRTEVEARAAVVRRMGEKFGMPVLSIQDELNRLTEKAPASHWLKDGVHPTACIHQLLADRWIEWLRSVE